MPQATAVAALHFVINLPGLAGRDHGSAWGKGDGQAVLLCEGCHSSMNAAD